MWFHYITEMRKVATARPLPDQSPDATLYVCVSCVRVVYTCIFIALSGFQWRIIRRSVRTPCSCILRHLNYVCIILTVNRSLLYNLLAYARNRWIDEQICTYIINNTHDKHVFTDTNFEAASAWYWQLCSKRARHQADADGDDGVL